MTGVPTLARRLFQLASVFTLAAVVMGAVVCATQSGFECGNWPGCTDRALLPHGPVADALYRNPWIEMTHRTSVILAGPAAIASAVVALRLRGVHPLVKILPWVTVAGAIVAGYVGRGIVIGQAFPAWVSAFDLGSALVAMGAMVTATVALERAGARWFDGAVGRLAWASTGTLLVMHLVSLYAAGKGSYTRCMSWPVWELLSADAQGNLALQWARFGLAALAAVLIAATVRAAWRTRWLRREAIAVAALLASVLALGLAIRATGSQDLGALYSILTVGLVFALVLLAARASLIPTTSPDRERAADAVAA